MSEIRYFDKMRTSSVPLEPCHGCENKIHCAINETACFAFWQYVEEKPISNCARIPTTEIYAQIFDEDQIQSKLL